jgi:peptidyl-prolyl cis-trans isomerase A (cyclophilin A)
MKIPVLCLCLGLAAFSTVAQAPASQAPATAPKPAPKPATAAHPATTTHMTTDPALLHPATLKAAAPETFDATFHTTKGDFVIQVTRSWAPLGADRFYNLVKHGFFTGAPFFRVLPGFVVQFGITGNPAVNKVWQDASIKDEPVKEHNLIGTVTFAKSQLPNSRTTQLFINLGDNSSNLDPQGFSPFGKVITGMDVVQNIYSGYGQQPDQQAIQTQGSAYFLKQYPKMDLIKSAVISSPAASPATHSGTSGTTTTHHSTPAPGTTPKSSQ